MYLRNHWYCAATAAELTGEKLPRVFLDAPVVMWRGPNGAPMASEHRRRPRRRYPLIERHGFVWIWMGDELHADPARIPDFHWNDDPGWDSVCDRLPVSADHLLLVDNLMDLSHVSFLHANTIGSPDDRNPDLVWERGPDWVRGTRIMRNCRPTPRMQKEGVTFNIDRVQLMTYTPPANVVIDLVTTESGRKPGASGPHNEHIVILNAMTPETEKSCHYFWASARDYRRGDPEFDRFIHKLTVVAFNEDKDMLEAEQRIIDLDPIAPQIDVAGDVGGLQSRRIFQRLWAEENAREAAE